MLASLKTLIIRLRETCIKLAQETEGAAKGYSAAILLGRDPVFEEVVLNPRGPSNGRGNVRKGSFIISINCKR